VLCDVPCSGLGTLRRNPELKLKEPKVPGQAFEILCNAQSFAKDRLLFSTCTINPQENELPVKEFMDRYPVWQLEFERQFFPASGGPDGFYISLLRKIR
jgi:16S rRNA (cytosine967-C5)-methyltransferase